MAKSVQLSKKSLSVKTGKKVKIRAKEILKSKNKTLKQHRKLCYESSNVKIATVSKKGIVKGKKKGKCIIYVYSQSGSYNKVKIKVK